MRKVRILLVVAVALVAGALTGPAAAHATTVQSTIASTAHGQLGKKNCPSSPWSNVVGCGGDWCSAFAKWVWGQAGINTTGIDGESGSFFGYGVIHHTLGATPHVGDAVVFNLHRDANGNPVTTPYNADHVGLVYAVSGSTFTMIGGNEGSSDNTQSTVNINILQSYIGAPYGSDTISGFVSAVESGVATLMDVSPVSGQFLSGMEGLGVYDSNEPLFHLDDNRDGVIDQNLAYGTTDDVAFAGNWTGSSTAGVGVFRGSTGTFYLDANRDGVTDANGHITFGTQGDLPIMGDWNGDGIDGIGVFRPSTGVFYLDDNRDGVTDANGHITFGTMGDLPITGDWNGDGIDGIGVYRPSTGMFYLDDNRDGVTDANGHIAYGTAGDRPVSGDWDGDGIDGVGLYRASNSEFFLDNNRDGSTDQWVSILPGI